MTGSFRVLVGLPSLNEADSIAAVTRDLDRALTTLPFPTEALLVNADNSSTDGTAAAFSSVPTANPKTTLTTPYRAGKGTNWQTLLRYALDYAADAVLFVDTDLAAVPESWVHGLLGAVRNGADYCYPLRPPTWNGGDLTYQLAYPLLAGVFGADLREPLCGDIAVSAEAVRSLLDQEWTPDELRFGVDFLAASLAVTGSWTTSTLTERRRNKLRSFSAEPTGDYRMGAKFKEVSGAIRHRIRQRLQSPPPAVLTPSPANTPVDSTLIVPDTDPDITKLAVSTSRRLRGEWSAIPAPLAQRLSAHANSDAVTRGLGWDDWRDCLFAWITQPEEFPPELLETLFLNRVVGHHTEIAGTAGWYATVRDQAHDVFAHRHALWAET